MGLFSFFLTLLHAVFARNTLYPSHKKNNCIYCLLHRFFENCLAVSEKIHTFAKVMAITVMINTIFSYEVLR